MKLHLQSRMASPGAFTLIELLLAVSIMAIIMVAINGVFMTALRMRDTAVNSLETTLPVEQALSVLQNDLANVICSTNTNGIFFGPLQSINQTNILPNQIGPDFYCSNGELDGVTPWGNMQKIDYLLAAPTNGSRGPGLDLIRAVTRNLLPLSQPTQPDEKHTILSGVQSLMFFYYDGTQWDQTWDTTQETNLPYAIKVQIHMAPVRGASVQAAPLELVVPLDVLLNTNTITPMQ
ncbi:MAG TPA: type II secretion system protein GspJ [Verrucomicrobiae bacterium]|jgi:prepilin-type N-terminal cleavage/methylation domain-containing protein|nr:type II secretion system protein GspJ [Verrucomicrobiae bacterium]